MTSKRGKKHKPEHIVAKLRAAGAIRHLPVSRWSASVPNDAAGPPSNSRQHRAARAFRSVEQSGQGHRESAPARATLIHVEASYATSGKGKRLNR